MTILLSSPVLATVAMTSQDTSSEASRHVRHRPVADPRPAAVLHGRRVRTPRYGRLEVMARTVTLTATLTPEEGGFVARCLELDVTSEGDTVEEALAMLREAVELYLEDEPLPDHLGHPVVTSFEVTVAAA